MKKAIASLLLLAVSMCTFAQSKAEKIGELLAAYNKQNQFNGAALVAEKGTVLLNKGYGFKNAETKALNTGQTIFQIGSVTKQFTATVILKLAENNKLQLTDKLSKYFPSFPKGDSITIHHLLTHTSGIYNYTNDPAFMQNEATKPAAEQKILALFENKPLDFSPGTQWAYSNSGYMLLGYIIQKVTRAAYEKAVRDFIFTPLHMANSGFDFVNLADTNKATGYFAMTGTAGIAANLVDSSVSFSAGAVYTTTSDLYKWHLGVLNNTIVKRESIEKAFTPFKNNYGYGWGIDSINGKRKTSHGGGIFGFNANLATIEQDNIAVILLNNVGNPKLDDITKDILAILYDMPYKLPQGKTEITLGEDILKKYAGTYQLAPQFNIVITLEDGRLYEQATGQQKFELFAQKENFFFLKVVEADVEFVSNKEGVVEKLILYQGGQKLPGVKIK